MAVFTREHTAQLTLFDDPPAQVTWFVPVDQYGRDLPPIACPGTDWKPANTWGYLAIQHANALGPDATLEALYEATTRARHVYYALTGDPTLEIELAQYRDTT